VPTMMAQSLKLPDRERLRLISRAPGASPGSQCLPQGIENVLITSAMLLRFRRA